MTVATHQDIALLADSLPEAAKDIRLNLKTVLNGTVLSPERAWGTALACAFNENPTPLADALLKDGAEHLSAGIREDAQAAAALMSMNNVYYRFRHMIGKEVYQSLPARLRMTRIAKPSGDKLTFELFCLAVSAINGCEMCVRSHERVLVEGGVDEQAIHEAVRIASVIRAAAVSLRLAA